MNDNRKYNPLLYAPHIVKTIIGVNIVMFIISILLSGIALNLTFNPFFFLSPSLDALKYLGGAGIRQDIIAPWKTLFAANWLHGSILHLVFNMLAVRTVVPLVIKEFGICRMFSLYTLTGIAGFYLSYIGGVPMTIGASCSICGLIGAALYFGKSRGGVWGQLVFKQTSGWVISLIIIGFLLPIINNWGHGGGLVAGIGFGWIFGYLEKRNENLLDKILALFLAAVTVYIIGQSLFVAVTWIFF